MDIDETNPEATIVGDLADAKSLPENTFDCVVLTQTLQLIYDVEAAIDNIYRALKPGGVLLMTVPGITHVPYERLRKTWYWSFTESSARRICETVFPKASISIEQSGNVLTASALLHGLVTEDLKEKELTYQDRDYQLIIAVRAVKPDHSP